MGVGNVLRARAVIARNFDVTELRVGLLALGALLEGLHLGQGGPAVLTVTDRVRRKSIV